MLFVKYINIYIKSIYNDHYLATTEAEITETRDIEARKFLKFPEKQKENPYAPERKDKRFNLRLLQNPY